MVMDRIIYTANMSFPYHYSVEYLLVSVLVLVIETAEWEVDHL